MIKSEFIRALERRSVIAAVRGAQDVRRAADSPASAVFLLGGSILTLEEMTRALHGAGKSVFVHLDLCEGLGKDAAAVEWCARFVKPDGFISTRSQPLRRAGELGLMTIQRIFLVDSGSLTGGMRHLSANPPDFIEVMPGLVTRALRRLSDSVGQPVIAGGMLEAAEDVEAALCAGALAASTSSENLWARTAWQR